MRAGGNAPWMRNPKKMFGAIKKWAEATNVFVPDCFLKPFLLTKMNALEGGELA